MSTSTQRLIGRILAPPSPSAFSAPTPLHSGTVQQMIGEIIQPGWARRVRIEISPVAADEVLQAVQSESARTVQA